MNTHDAKERAQDLLRETDNQIRANPIPAVLVALGVGIAIGLLSRLIEPPARRREPLHDALDDIRSLLASGARKGRSAYAHSAEAVRDAVEQAVEKARDIDVDPVAKWWKRIWS
jgi:ElaB/YqjD/DUF883 family membrane-anchored ribosome-binding protein